jgi:hypothetical protein
MCTGVNYVNVSLSYMISDICIVPANRTDSTQPYGRQLQ